MKNERINPIIEAKIICLTEEGKNRKEIAKCVCLSERTVFKYQKDQCLV